MKRYAIGESGEIEFDVATGELRRSKGPTQRLGPQPAALLSLLIERQGDVVGREEIRAALWSDVSVEFDASLHHCVRQVRAAFGEKASDALYIETIPKRGYRLKARVVELEPAPAPPLVLEPVAAPLGRSRRGVLPVLGLGVLGLGALCAWLLWPKPLRVAIMPFEHPDMSATALASAARLAEQILVDVTHRMAARADVIGPRTTGPLRERGLSLDDVASRLDLAYVINARFTAPSLLIELIRSHDGKHVWVERYDQPAQWEAAGPEIVEGVVGILERE